MNNPQPVEDLVNTLFGTLSLTDLAEADKQVMQTILGTLATALGSENANLSTLPDDCPFDAQDDSSLISAVEAYVSKALSLSTILATRSSSKPNHRLIGQVELQLTELTFSISDLQQSVQSPTRSSTSLLPWQIAIKGFLLKDFDFINRWLRCLL